MKALSSGESLGTTLEVSYLSRILFSFLPSFLLSNFFCLFFLYRFPFHTVFCSYILVLFLFYRLLLSSFSFEFFYFTVSLVQLICFSFVIHWLKYLPFVLFKNDNSATCSGARPLTQWGPGALSIEVERPGLEADHPPPSIGITPLLLHCLHAVHWDDSTLSRSLSRLLCLRFVPIHILYFLSFLFL